MSLVVILSFAGALLGAALALGLLARGPRSLVHLALVLGLGILATEALCTGLVLHTGTIGQTALWLKGRHVAMAFLPGIWLLFSLIYARASWNEFVARWRLALLAMFLLPPLLCIVFQDELLADWTGGRELPPDFIGLGWAGLALHLVLLLGCVLILMNLERTFLASVGTMRWRLKFMVLGVGLIFGVRLYTCSQALLYRAVNLALPVVDALALAVGCVLIAISLLRARLANIEIYPSQSVLHGSLTASLAGLYLVMVGLSARFVSALGGSVSFPIQAFLVLLAIVGLGVLLLSDRIRQRLRLAVSRHFRRPMYDYRKVWSEFTERTTSLMDRIAFSRAVAKLISETFGCLSVTVWLVDEQQPRLVFAASTLLGEDHAQRLVEGQPDAVEVLKTLREHPQPVDIDSGQPGPLAGLANWNPEFFGKGGNRVCVPLVSGGEVLGILALADRVSGLRFSVADLDLLKCIGDQVAASLRNIRLSERILRAKELEAFQDMSTFFVHDLKNMASTLSLMLQNMSEHFGNPEFREDALKAVAMSVTRLNNLVRRFSLLRQGLKMSRVECDLNEVVSSALAGLGNVPSITLDTELTPLPRLWLDPDQIQKVITNLVVNAREAINHHGSIQVGTKQSNGHALIVVSDNGVGMSHQFVKESLFRPFQTTKKDGLGIGMFHSRMIVEAHRGRIEVVSEPSKGTTFRVFLPIKDIAA